jgi:hypothetical protein
MAPRGLTVLDLETLLLSLGLNPEDVADLLASPDICDELTPSYSNGVWTIYLTKGGVVTEDSPVVGSF